MQENSNFLDRKHFRVTGVSPSTNHRQTREEASVFRNLPSLRVNSHCFAQGTNSLFFLLFVTDCDSLGVVRACPLVAPVKRTMSSLSQKRR